MLNDIGSIDLLDGFPEPLLAIKPDGALLHLNAAALELLEITGGYEGRRITDLLPETERTRLDPLSWLQRWAETPDAPEMDYVHLICRTDTGAQLPVRVRVGRYRSQAETVYLVMLQDISLDQNRQQQTRAAHRLAARVLAISADAIITVGSDLKISYANPSAEGLFGYGSGALIGLPLDDLLPARYRASHPDQIARFARESRPARLMGERAEVIGLTQSGEEIPLEASITKVTLDKDMVFSAHLRDLRKRKAAEQQIARTRTSMATVFEHALQAMALIDAHGKVLEMNGAARQLLPADAEPIGAEFTSLPFYSSDPDATARLLRDGLKHCFAGETYRVTTSITLPGRAETQLDFSLTPVREGETVFAIIAEARDLLAPGGRLRA